MIGENRVLAVIPARGGSKGVPGKNIRDLDGLPLIAYSILEAKYSKYLDKIIVSSDDEKIAAAAKEHGAQVMMRSPELGSDSSPVTLTHIETITKLEEQGFHTDILVMLQCTTPFRVAQDIDKALELMHESNADSVVSVCEAPNKVNPHWVRKIVDGKLVPYLDDDNSNPHAMRQELPPVYWRNGQIYIVKRDVLFRTQNMYGDISLPYIMPRGFHVNIDEESDFLLAQTLREKKLVRMTFDKDNS